MSQPLTIWCNAKFVDEANAELVAGIGEHRLLIPAARSSNLTAGSASPELAEADVAFGQPDPTQIAELSSLKWVHLTSAGYTRYDTDKLRGAFAARGAALTNSSSVFDDPCAQHILAFMLAQSRQIPASVAAQIGPHAWIYDQLRPVMRVLKGDSVLMLGYGAIAKRLVELLAPFHLNVTALRRSVRGDEVVPTHPISELLHHLSQADHVVNVLPSNPSSDGLIDAHCFSAMKSGAIFYNVGRGTTVDQAALREALISGRLAAAYLDVTDPEPSPPDDPIWTTPNCWITPHVAGGHQEEEQELVRHFLRNLRNYEAGRPLVDRIM